MNTDPALVSLVGGGPGHPDLLTLAAEHALGRAREIVADRSLAPLLDALTDEGLFVRGEGVAVTTLVADDQPANVELLAAIDRGPSVVRLYRGDPWLHPFGDCERARLRAAGVRFSSVAGVVEELAVAAAAGLPVQVRTLAVATTFAVDAISSSECSEHTPATDSALRTGLPADPAHTLVVRTADLVATAGRLVERALLDGVDLDRPATALPTSPGLGGAVRATLGNLADRCPAGPGVVVVGLVAALDTGNLSMPMVREAAR